MLCNKSAALRFSMGMRSNLGDFTQDYPWLRNKRKLHWQSCLSNDYQRLSDD